MEIVGVLRLSTSFVVVLCLGVSGFRTFASQTRRGFSDRLYGRLRFYECVLIEAGLFIDIRMISMFFPYFPSLGFETGLKMSKVQARKACGGSS
jgi:hypothetical protein